MTYSVLVGLVLAAVLLPSGCQADLIEDANKYYDARQFDKAFPLFMRAAERGDPVGEFSVGVMYRDGAAVKRDYAAALRWYRAAAEKGKEYDEVYGPERFKATCLIIRYYPDFMASLHYESEAKDCAAGTPPRSERQVLGGIAGWSLRIAAHSGLPRRGNSAV